MISNCTVCKADMQCSRHPSGEYVCREHYLPFSEIIIQNRQAALISQSELRALGIGCRRMKQMPVIEERRTVVNVMHGNCD